MKKFSSLENSLIPKEFQKYLPYIKITIGIFIIQIFIFIIFKKYFKNVKVEEKIKNE